MGIRRVCDYFRASDAVILMFLYATTKGAGLGGGQECSHADKAK